MCGICGIIYADPHRDVEQSVLAEMTKRLTHRGPDDEGYLLDGPLGLGMRRLSIIDVAGGRQPIHNEDASIHTVYNGEIYNYRELKSTLESAGHAFSTRSDTEVIVHAYEEYGGRFLQRLRGMFALAVWDSRAARLTLAVDRFGIKPLYYLAGPDGLVFGSELSSLTASGMVQRSVDFGALAQYFTLGYIPAPDCIFEGVRKLPPGHVLGWSREGGLAVRRYWDIPSGLPRKRSTKQTRGELREHLRDAVRSHLVSDVPLGAFLSGGIDSSTVVAAMSEVSPGAVKTFSVGFREKEHNELDIARQVARRFGTEHHELILEPETVEILPSLVGHFGEPFADSSAIPTYYVSKAAREFVKVALSGDGGDEMFVGYPTFLGVELARLLRLPPQLSRPLGALLAKEPRFAKPSWNEQVARWTKRLSDTLKDPPEAFRSKIAMLGLGAVSPLLSPELRETLATEAPFLRIDEALARYSGRAHRHPLDAFLAVARSVSLPGDMLVKVDRMSMANSLEVRVPLLDHLLAEFAGSVPVRQLLPQWRLKGLLKDTMSDVLPPSVLRHPKHGFTMPLAAWFRGDLAEFAAEVLLGDRARKRGFFDHAALRRFLSGHRQATLRVGSTLWSLLVFELWCQQFLDE